MRKLSFVLLLSMIVLVGFAAQAHAMAYIGWENTIAAYDVNGRLVRTLWNGEMDAGVRTVTWDGRTDRGARAPGGVYFLRFESGNQRAVRRLAILR